MTSAALQVLYDQLVSGLNAANVTRYLSGALYNPGIWLQADSSLSGRTSHSSSRPPLDIVGRDQPHLACASLLCQIRVLGESLPRTWNSSRCEYRCVLLQLQSRPTRYSACGRLFRHHELDIHRPSMPFWIIVRMTLI